MSMKKQNFERGTRSRRSVLLSVLGCTVALSGMFAASAGYAEDKPVIAVSVADQKSLFYVAAVDGMRDAAAKAGYELKVASASNDANLQVKQVQDLLVQNPGALIFISQDSTAGAAGVKAANKADVPVVAVDQKPESGSGKLATFIATDSVKAARELCTWMFEKIGGKGDVAILHGVLGSTAELQRTQGCQEALKAFPGIRVVAEQTANWDETEAFKVAQNILTANPNLKAIFGESDAMAMGAAKAAKQAGRDGLIFVGIDGFPTMFDAVQAGLVQATMAQNPYHMGMIAVDNAVKIIKGEGKDIPVEQYQSTTLVTKENVATTNPVDFYGPKAKGM